MDCARLVCVDPCDVEKVWPKVEPLLRRAIERTQLSDFDSCTSALFTGAHLLWMAIADDKIEAIATTELAKVGSRKICTIVACAGENRERWLPLIAGIEKFAKNEGCDAMRIYGRRGWKRVLDDYRIKYVVLEKVL